MPSDQPAWVRTRRELIGNRIREARRDANLSQIELGDRVGLDHKTIHRIEYGVTDPRLGTLIQIAEATGVELGELLE